MTLSSGTRLGSFEIHSPLGAGGMGEVYKARDTRLGRDVAIKVLPSAVADDPDRLGRFGREAQVLASLNHPNIAQIHGLEEAGGVRAIVMEFVDGPTLAEVLAGEGAPPALQQLSVADALALARQIADALEAAHEKGIIHRDLKPSNIKIRSDGTVKLLDFGLAKALENPIASPSASALAVSPTLSVHATQAGVLLGTAAYMSPEQAAGKAADRRSDLWAFGVVLLEMLTGRPAFTGETIADVLAAVLRSEPDWATLPAHTPVPIRRLLRRCLEKDRRRRIDSALIARLEIEEALAPGAPEAVTAAATPPRTLIAWLAAAFVVGTILALVATWILRDAPPPPPVTSRFAVAPPSPGPPMRTSQFENVLALSPDGRRLVYALQADARTRGSGTGGTLMLRPLDSLDARPLVPVGRDPFFSPDGAWLGYFDDNDFMLRKVSLSGSSPVDICAFAGGPRGASWGEDNAIVFATADPTTGLWRVPSGGGEPEVLTRPDAGQPLRDHLFPSVLPRGRGILFTIAEPGRPEAADIAVLDLRTGRHHTLIRGGSQARYVQSGHLVYAAAGTLRAVRFDLDDLQVLGDAVPVVEGVIMTPVAAAFYDASRQGTLAYVSGTAAPEQPRSLAWVDRRGSEQRVKAPVRPYAAARLSPDGTRVALAIRDQERDIWIWDFARETLRKLTHGPATDESPEWTPDGRHLVFASNRGGSMNLYMQAADGSGPVRRLTSSHTAQWPTAVTHDSILGHEFGAATSFDLFLFRFDKAAGPSSGATPPGVDGKVRPLVRDAVTQTQATLSPDGRYVAYQSNESGPFEIYVRPFPEVGRAQWQVSAAGGTRPVWAGNGELFYVDASGALLAVRVSTDGPTLTWDNPAKIHDVGSDHPLLNFRAYDVAPDGRRILLLRNEPGSGSGAESPHVTVVINWAGELEARVPAGR